MKVIVILRILLIAQVFVSLILISGCDEELETPPEVVSSDERVDLRPQQTAIRNQGSRNTCITFAAVAALEASYKRLGYGDINLSEEFMNHMGKTFWLHPKWDEILAKGEDGSETQVGAFGGGGGAGYVNTMHERGLRIPLESLMPYQTFNYTTSNDPTLADNDFRAEVYKKQRIKSNFNLDPNKLTYDLLHSDKFYGVSKAKYYKWDTGKARDTDFIESVLKRGIEVVWDFSGPTKYGDIWRPCSDDEMSCDTIAHSMLIVGFDKTSENPDDHYFLVKNSWGSTWASTSDNFTKVSYEYIRNLGTEAAYIEIPHLDPQEWEEFKFIGRWNLVFDGHDGVLDIYHLPGFWEEDFLGVPDRRIGSFYTPDGKAYKINGSIEGNKITFYLDGDNPNAKWDELGGRKFEYYLSDDDYMAGFHTDPGGGVYAGYAIKGELVSEGTTTPRPFLPKSYENSSWELLLDERAGTVELGTIAPYEGEFPEYYDIFGTFTDEDGEESDFQMRIPQTEYSHFYMQLRLDGDAVSLEGRHLNHTQGNISGHTTGGFEVTRPFVMTRK